MTSILPLIVGFGGYNAAGRSSFHHGYKRCVYESLNATTKAHTLQAIRALQSGAGRMVESEAEVLAKTLVRQIDNSLFDVQQVAYSTALSSIASVSLEIPKKSLPPVIPKGWIVKELAHGMASLVLPADTSVLANTPQPMAVQSAGQLPSGFDPGQYYRSNHHPRGLQLAVVGASDCLHSMGVEWSEISRHIKPDQVCVYASSVMSQMDQNGNGGLLRNRLAGQRATSKQLAMGLNSMPADFLNAYVLGSVGTTAAVTGACATFLYNLKQGVEDIRTGRAELAFVGASEAPIVPEVIDGYAAMSALATDDDLRKLDGSNQVNHRRASRPFGDNAGFTLGESSQFVVLMSPRLAARTGATIFGAVPGVYVHADGFKKSISSPGAGNYLTMARATALAANLLGDDAIQRGSFVQAHGSSTPQNRVTESAIFDKVARAFDIEKWPVAAVKSYVGHSLAPASGDQLVNSLGVFAHGVLPGIKTISGVADDVHASALSISTHDTELDTQQRRVALLNSKGFGGNNATACVFNPDIAHKHFAKDLGKQNYSAYLKANESSQERAKKYDERACEGQLDVIYNFGQHIVDEEDINISRESVDIPGFNDVSLLDSEAFKNF